MRQRQMIHQAGVMLFVRFVFMKRVLRILGNYCSLIWLVVRELSIAKATIKTDSRKELKLTSHSLHSKNA